MSNLQELEARLSKAEARRKQLADQVESNNKVARKREALSKALRAEEIALDVDAKMARFREIVKELPALVFDLDTEAKRLIGASDSVERARLGAVRALEDLYRRNFDTKVVQGYDIMSGLPRRGQSIVTKEAPAWIPRLNWLARSYRGAQEIAAASWKRAAESRKEVTHDVEG